MRTDQAKTRAGVLMLYRSITDVIAKLAMLALTVAAARQLSTFDFAMFSLATTLGWLGSVAGDFGLHAHVARSVARQPERAASLIARWLPLRLLFAVLAFLAAVAVLPLLGIRQDRLLAVSIITASYTLLGGCEFFYHALRGLGRTDVESSVTVVQRISLGACGLAALWWRPSLIGLSLAMAIPAIASLIAVGSWTTRLAPRSPDRISGSSADRRWPEFVTSVAPIGIGIVLAAAYFRIDILLIEHWTGATAVAHYNAVFRIVDALRLFPAAVLAVILPTLCRANDTHALVQVSSRLTAAAVSSSVVLWVAAPSIVLALFGEAFAEAIPLFRTLLLAFPLMTLNYALTQQLIAWHGHRAFALACAAALASNLTLNWILIPSHGALGAAWTTVWTECVLLSVCVLALTRISPAVALPPLDGSLQQQAEGSR